LVGPGIQDNIYGLSRPEFYVYDVQSFGDGHHYVMPMATNRIANILNLRHVPVIVTNRTIWVDDTIDDILLSADGFSELNPKVLREGLVFKANTAARLSWKAISNKYLLKQK